MKIYALYSGYNEEHEPISYYISRELAELACKRSIGKDCREVVEVDVIENESDIEKPAQIFYSATFFLFDTLISFLDYDTNLNIAPNVNDIGHFTLRIENSVPYLSDEETTEQIEDRIKQELSDKDYMKQIDSLLQYVHPKIDVRFDESTSTMDIFRTTIGTDISAYDSVIVKAVNDLLEQFGNFIKNLVNPIIEQYSYKIVDEALIKLIRTDIHQRLSQYWWYDGNNLDKAFKSFIRRGYKSMEI